LSNRDQRRKVNGANSAHGHPCSLLEYGGGKWIETRGGGGNSTIATSGQEKVEGKGKNPKSQSATFPKLIGQRNNSVKVYRNERRSEKWGLKKK